MIKKILIMDQNKMEPKHWTKLSYSLNVNNKYKKKSQELHLNSSICVRKKQAKKTNPITRFDLKIKDQI